jgi:hypothetical protein
MACPIPFRRPYCFLFLGSARDMAPACIKEPTEGARVRHLRLVTQDQPPGRSEQTRRSHGFARDVGGRLIGTSATFVGLSWPMLAPIPTLPGCGAPSLWAAASAAVDQPGKSTQTRGWVAVWPLGRRDPLPSPGRGAFLLLGRRLRRPLIHALRVTLRPSCRRDRRRKQAGPLRVAYATPAQLQLKAQAHW